MSPLPLKWRVMMTVLAIVTGVVATLSAVAYHELHESLLSNIDMTLRYVAGVVKTQLDERAGGGPLQADLESILGRPSSQEAFRYRLWLEGSEGAILAGDLDAGSFEPVQARLARGARPEAGNEVFGNLRIDGLPYRMIWFRHPTNRGTVSAVIASSSRYTQHEMEEFLRLLVILGGSVILAAAVLTGLSAAWSLRPVRSIASRLQRVTAQNLGAEHLAGIEPPSELAPFRDAVAGMLARLDKAAQSQKRFTADASHELRTPLALAKSTLQTVQLSGKTVREYEQAVEEVLQDIDRMEKLTRQLLTMAELDEAGVRPALERVALHELLREVVDEYQSRAPGASGRVQAGETATATVEGSRGELKLLFGNLIDNALHYGPSEGAVRMSLVRDGPDSCLVRVHDDGGNIPAEHLDRLFDRFYRVENSRSRAAGGAGLGLAIARKIVHRHGGDIRITSSPEKGTDVLVRLPRVS